MGETIAGYYDGLSEIYPLIFQDWEQAILRQASWLDATIRRVFPKATSSILDAACGIGTQVLGMAQLGYEVTGSDISPEAIHRARREAQMRALDINFSVCDMRELWAQHTRQFGVVIAMDNAIPHLENEAEITRAFEQFLACCQDGGGCVISLRDYAQIQSSGKQIYPRRVIDRGEETLILFDVWAFEGRHYNLTTYLLREHGEQDVAIEIFKGGRYFCVLVEEIEALMLKSGFREVTTLRDGFYQPVVIGKK